MELRWLTESSEHWIFCSPCFEKGIGMVTSRKRSRNVLRLLEDWMDVIFVLRVDPWAIILDPWMELRVREERGRRKQGR